MVLKTALKLTAHITRVKQVSILQLFIATALTGLGLVLLWSLSRDEEAHIDQFGGAIVGRIVGDVFNTVDPTLYVLLGIAAFLGAGYRVPLAAVTFVAETTGKPNFVVPAL